MPLNAQYERLSTNNVDDTQGQKRPSQKEGNQSRHDGIENEEIELNIDEHNLKFLNEGKQFAENNQDNTGVGINGSVYLATSTAMGKSSKHFLGSRLMQVAIGSLATILLYLTLSICLTFYQKALIKKLKFPLCIVTYHLLIKYMLAALARSFWKRNFGKTPVQLDWRTAVRKIAPTGIASGIDIGFSNWGLELVPISLYTMTKSSTIVFILVFAIFLGLEKKSWSLVFIVSLIATGLFMFTYKSTQFDALGFMLILVASFSSGVRWSFAQFVMQKSKLGLHNPIDMIYHMQPWMILPILPFLGAFEGQKLYGVFRNWSSVSNEVISLVTFKITFGAVLAFFMEVSEFLVLSKTSSLTLSIAGIFKDIFQLALAVELNGDQLSVTNVFGLTVCLAGISCHLVHKYSMLVKIEDLDNTCVNDFLYAATSSTSSGAAKPNHNTTSASFSKTHSAQRVPLLEHSDSDDSINGEEVDSSEVIFDVLKRRDIVR